MNQTQSRSILDQMLDPLSRCLDAGSARRMIESKPAPEVNDRVEYLAQQANEGLLTAQERQEYETYIKANHFISMIKLKARQLLAENDSQ